MKSVVRLSGLMKNRIALFGLPLILALAWVALAQVPVAPTTPKAPAAAPAAPSATNPPASATPAGTNPAESDVSPAGEPIRIQVKNITAPVTVLDKDGNIMDNLQPSQFHLYDNGKEQDIHVDTEFQPISLVIAIEASYRDDAILKQIHKIGSLIEPMITGDSGEAAVIAFDHRVRTLQDFTNDAEKVKTAISKIQSGSTSSRMIDAVDSAVLMLRNRDPKRRRIILLVSETRDKGSVARGRQTLVALQLYNCTVYTVDISQLSRRLTEQPEPPRPSAIPPEARQTFGGPSTPTSAMHDSGIGNSVEFVPALKEIYTDTKALFVKNPVETFTRGTGGAQFSFLKQRGLEDAVAKVGADIHNQYLISYAPNNLTEGGFHEIRVDVSYPRARARTRPGYWIATVNQ